MAESTRTWLLDRADGVPETLTRHMLDALGEGGDAVDIAATVRRAADDLISEAIRHASSGNAERLLAADALITYACEAVSELDPTGLSRLS